MGTRNVKPIKCLNLLRFGTINDMTIPCLTITNQLSKCLRLQLGMIHVIQLIIFVLKPRMISAMHNGSSYM